MLPGLVKATHPQRQYYCSYLAPHLLSSLRALGAEPTLDILASTSRDHVDEYDSFLDLLDIGG